MEVGKEEVITTADGTVFRRVSLQVVWSSCVWRTTISCIHHLHTTGGTAAGM